jgi:hypothetical protein
MDRRTGKGLERPKTVLTFRMDDEIVNDLFEKFPEFKFDDALRNLDEDWMKSKAGKEKWRAFIMPVSPKPKPEPTGSFDCPPSSATTPGRRGRDEERVDLRKS